MAKSLKTRRNVAVASAPFVEDVSVEIETGTADSPKVIDSNARRPWFEWIIDLTDGYRSWVFGPLYGPAGRVTPEKRAAYQRAQDAHPRWREFAFTLGPYAIMILGVTSNSIIGSIVFFMINVLGALMLVLTSLADHFVPWARRGYLKSSPKARPLHRARRNPRVRLPRLRLYPKATLPAGCLSNPRGPARE